MPKQDFDIIACCSLSETKQLVISKLDEKVVIAQRIVAMDSGRERYFYEKGSIIIPKECKHNFINILKEVIKSFEK